jgi:hypothetical protein
MKLSTKLSITWWLLCYAIFESHLVFLLCNADKLPTNPAHIPMAEYILVVCIIIIIPFGIYDILNVLAKDKENNDER